MQVLKISILPWSIELGNVLIDQVITIQWECKTCNTNHTQDVTSLARFSTKQVDLDLKNLGSSLICTHFFPTS